jgi:hypothetical protein
MRYRLYANPEADEQHCRTEDELIEALSRRGWDLQQKAAEQVAERRAARLARRAANDSSRTRRHAATR